MELVDWFNLAVYTQPFLFGLLLNWKQRIEPVYIYVLGLVTSVFIAGYGDIGHYTVPILIQYVFMVCFMVYYYDYHGLTGFKPVSLAFLMVFLNSYFWEFPIHVLGTLIGFNLFKLQLFLLQSLHLVPVFFLSRFPEVELRKWKRVYGLLVDVWLMVLVFIGVKLLAANFFGVVPFSWVIDAVCRFYGLMYLAKIFHLRVAVEVSKND